MKKTILTFAAITVSAVAIASVVGSSRTVTIPGSQSDEPTSPRTETRTVTPATGDSSSGGTRVSGSETRIPGTEDIATWSAWTHGSVTGQSSSTVTIDDPAGTATEVANTRTGGERRTRQVQEGDFMVTYEYNTEITATFSVPQIERTTTTAGTRVDTRTCNVTVRGVADSPAPTCDPNLYVNRGLVDGQTAVLN